MAGLAFDQHIAGANDPIKPGRETVGDKDHWPCRQVGKGRVIYIPELVDPATQPSLFNADHTYNFGLDLTNWRVPEKADEVRKALAWLLDEGPSMRVKSERGVLANYYRQSGTGRFYCHLVNLLEKAVPEIVFDMDVPAGSQVASVRVISPDGVDAERHRWEVAGTHLLVELARLDIYSVIIIQTT